MDSSGSKNTHILRAENLHKSYRKRPVVKGISLEVTAGEVVGLLGPNGAGKTTTFYMIMGLVRPETGKIWLGQEELSRQPVYRRARKGIGYLAQEPSVFQKLSVEDNLRAVLEYQSLSSTEIKNRIDLVLKELDIDHLRANRADTLSGGERRRVEVARALVLNPKFLLLDEPFTGIDPIAVGEIQEIIRKLKARQIGILISDHNVRETLWVCDRAYILYSGEILLNGTPSEIVANPQARAVYLGEKFEM